VGRLGVAQLEAEPPVVRLLAAESRQDAHEAREGDVGRLGQRLGCEKRRAQQLATQREEIVERAAIAVRRRASERLRQPERLDHRSVEVVGERHLRRVLDSRGEHLEARVRVDAPLPWPRDRLRIVGGEPGRMREQLADRRALRPCGCVEVDDALLDRDERRDRCEELRHRGPRQHLVARTDGAELLVGARHRDGRAPCRPRGDLFQRVHGGRY